MADNMQDVNLICCYGGFDAVAKLQDGNRFYVHTIDGSPSIIKGQPDNTTDSVRWIHKMFLHPAECTCLPDGPICRACQDWNRIANGDEMPF